jgi:uncharacterized membrane protein
MEQVIQITGSLCVLVPFVLAQFGRLDSRSVAYASLNLVGSTVLSVQAAQGRQWGFLLLEGVWAGVSLLALLRAVSGAVDKAPTNLDRTST